MSFLTLIPFTRRITNNCSRIRHHLENPKTQRVRLKHPSTAQRQTKTGCIRRVRGVVIGWPPSPPPGQHNTTQRGLPWVIIPSSGKREPRGDNQHPPQMGLFCRRLYSDLISQGLQGNTWQWTTGNVAMMEKGWGSL